MPVVSSPAVPILSSGCSCARRPLIAAVSADARGHVDAPPVAPRHDGRGHEGAAQRKCGTRDRRVPGQACARLRVDQELRRWPGIKERVS